MSNSYLADGVRDQLVVLHIAEIEVPLDEGHLVYPLDLRKGLLDSVELGRVGGVEEAHPFDILDIALDHLAVVASEVVPEDRHLLALF